MKKILGLFFVMVVCCGFLFADEYVVGRYDYYSGTYSIEDEMALKYDDEDNVYYFYNGGSYVSYWFEFGPTELKQIQNAAKKALEWEKVAKENKAEISKDLPEGTFNVDITKKSGSSWYYGKKPVPVKMVFSSVGEGEVCAILLVGGSTVAKSNEYIDLEFEGQIIIDIQQFADAVSEESIKAAIEKHNGKSSQVDSLFN